MNIPFIREALWRSLLAATTQPDPDTPVGEAMFHIVGTVDLAALLAERRGIDRDVATAAMLLHDIGRLDTGRLAGHAEWAAAKAPAILAEAGFAPDQIAEIVRAVATHQDKAGKGSPLEELVRDADVLEVYLSGAPLPPVFADRVRALRADLQLTREV